MTVPGSAAAQVSDAVPAGAGFTISGFVHDSLAGSPLADATVQLVSADDPIAFSRTAVTDPLGRFEFGGVPSGRYSIGFLHPLLDTLGVAAPVREVRVEGTELRGVELAVPSAASLEVAICGPRLATDSTAFLIGTVRDPADRMPAADATVRGEWLEVTFGRGGMRQRVDRLTATTGDNGWFALCGLPMGQLWISAYRGSDSTAAVDLQVPADGFLRRDLYLPGGGRGRLRGRVVTADGARPVAGARITIVRGPEAESNAQGEWTLPDAPLGTQLVEVRAIGYYRDRRAVDILPENPALEVAIATVEAVLDTVRVTASRLGDRDQGGFVQRQRGSGMGRFFTAERLMQENPNETSDLFRTLPGFIGDGSLRMRGNFSDGAGNFGVPCTPEVYIDGHLLRGLDAMDVDAFVAPQDIAAIEVYSAGSPKPPQFDSGMSGCGSLVIWRKPINERMAKRRR